MTKPPSLFASCGKGLLTLVVMPVVILAGPLLFIGVVIYSTIELFRATWTMIRKGQWIVAIAVLPFGLSAFFGLGFGAYDIEVKWLAAVYRFVKPWLKGMT